MNDTETAWKEFKAATATDITARGGKKLISMQDAMKKSESTPGPWEINNNIGRKGELGIVAEAAPCIVAVMGNAGAWPAEAKANAALIAAGPDMLAALKFLTEAARTEPGMAVYKAHIEKAEAVIARATSANE